MALANDHSYPAVSYSTAVLVRQRHAFGPANVTPFQGDFDGDGYTDLAYYQSSTATWFMYDSKSNTVSSFALGTPNSSVPVVGYFDANAPEELAVFTVVNGQGVWTIASAISGLRTVTFGQSGDIPVPGDYDGLGYDELAVYRPTTGNFYVLEPNGTTKTLPLNVGSSPDIKKLVPVPGQYDNSTYYQQALNNPNTVPNTPIFGVTEAAVFDPVTGVYTILGPGNITKSVGFSPGDIPAPSDYAGKGSTQPAVFRPSNGNVYEIINNQPTVIASFGAQASADIPLAAPLSIRTPGPIGSVAPAAVTGTTPAAGTAGVALGSTITATFSEPVQAPPSRSCSRTAVALHVAAAVNYNAATNTVTLTPKAALSASSTYTATVSGAMSMAGMPMTSPVSWSFITDKPPAVASATPSAGATAVSVHPTVAATFTEPVQGSTISFVLKSGSGNTVAAAMAYNAGTDTVALTPTAALAPSTTYTATVSGAVDMAGTAMTSPISWSFTTAAAVPPPAPLVDVSKVQLVKNKAKQVTEILVTFSGAVNMAEADSANTYRLATPGTKGSYTAKNAGIIKLKSAVYNGTSDTVVLTPTKPFALTKPVQLVVYGTGASGLKDAEGRMIDGDHNNTAGGNAVVILSGSTPSAAVALPTPAPKAKATPAPRAKAVPAPKAKAVLAPKANAIPAPKANAAAVDALMELGAFAHVTTKKRTLL